MQVIGKLRRTAIIEVHSPFDYKFKNAIACKQAIP